MKTSGNKNSKFGGRERLLKISLNEFSKRGVDQVSVDEIVNRLSVAKGTFYYYFSSKDALFWELIDTGLEKLKEVVDNEIKMGALGNKLFIVEAEFFLGNIEWSQLFAGEYWKMKDKNKKACKHVDDSLEFILRSIAPKRLGIKDGEKNMLFWIPLIFSLRKNYMKQRSLAIEDKKYLIDLAEKIL